MLLGKKQFLMFQEKVKQLEDNFMAVQAEQEDGVMDVSREIASAILSFECKFVGRVYLMMSKCQYNIHLCVSYFNNNLINRYLKIDLDH